MRRGACDIESIFVLDPEAFALWSAAHARQRDRSVLVMGMVVYCEGKRIFAADQSYINYGKNTCDDCAVIQPSNVVVI